MPAARTAGEKTDDAREGVSVSNVGWASGYQVPRVLFHNECCDVLNVLRWKRKAHICLFPLIP